MEVGPIAMECPSCQKRLRIPLSAAGKKVRCPGCGSAIAVPAPVSAPPAAPPPAAASTPEGAFDFDTDAPVDRSRRANSEPPPPPPGSKTAGVFSVIFLVVGIVTYEIIVLTQFPRERGEGFRIGQMIGAAVVGAVCAVLGGRLGVLDRPADGDSDDGASEPGDSPRGVMRWRLREGDILDVPADVLVCSANVYLTLSGGVGGAFLLRYGPAMQDALQQYLIDRGVRPVERRTVVELPPCRSPYRAVLHAAAVDGFYSSSPKAVREVVAVSLERASHLSARLVAPTALAMRYGPLSVAEFACGLSPVMAEFRRWTRS